MIVLGNVQTPRGRELLDEVREYFQVVEADSVAALSESPDCPAELSRVTAWESSRDILNQMPEGVAILDTDLRIVWQNERFARYVAELSRDGEGFYSLLGLDAPPEPSECALRLALAGKPTVCRTLRAREGRYFEIQATRLNAQATDADRLYLLATARDVSVRENNRQKFNSIYHAGLDLGDLSPVDVMQLSPQERIELLKMKILHYTQDVMKYETIEIRLFDRASGDLNLLLEVGMSPEAAQRKLKASTEGNGVTGWVAATGKSVLCPDTSQDQRYLAGALGARSSLTVPLIFQEEVLGTFNVESPLPEAFNDEDKQFLEMFSREIASAINTLDLLTAEQITTAVESTQLVLSEVATPVDKILNDAAWVLEKYIGHEAALCERLQRILRGARQIRQLIHKAGETLTQSDSSGTLLLNRPGRPALRGKRILVADNEESVRHSAHELLERYGCEVETAQHGEEACLMTRSFQYDLVIADIRLPDMNGFECFTQLKRIDEQLPVILMSGYGYDPTHSIVKARQQGLQGVLYKPFRLDQLLDEIEKAVTAK